MRVRFQLLLIAAVVLVVYYPAIFAEFSMIDDLGTVEALRGMTGSFKSIFVPGEGGGLYYRPLLMLSLFLDKYLWSFDSSFMHLENILLHLVNALLVFLLSRQLLEPESSDRSRLPLISSLLFALHPINVESVSWVSGRTDPLACSFVLGSAICLIRFVQRGRLLQLLPAALLLFLGCITKESAVGFFLGAVFLLLARPQAEGPGAERAGRILLLVLVLGGSIALVFLLRSLAYTSNKSNIGLTISYWKVNPLYSALTVLRAYAFYIKKIFWPWPLNFAIEQVDPLYELCALPLSALTLLIAWRRTILSALFLGGVGLMAPAFVIAFGQIASTPFSERYVYMSSAFIVPAAVHYLGALCARMDRAPLRLIYRKGAAGPGQGAIELNGVTVARLLLLVALPLSLAGTMERVRLWRSNLSLSADSVAKSPDSKEMRSVYGASLYRAGDLEGAERELAVAASLYSFAYDPKYELNYATLLRERGKLDRAEAVCNQVLEKTRGKSRDAWEQRILLLQAQIPVCPPQEREALRHRLLAACDRFCSLGPAPEKLYLLGQTALALNDRERAARYFRGARDGLAPESPFLAAAARLSREPL